MGLNVRNAIFLGPELSARYQAASPRWLQTAVDEFLAQGIVVFLSVLEAGSVAGAVAWYEATRASDGFENLRLVTPGRLLWPEGEVRMPLDTGWSADRMARAHALIGPLLSSAGGPRLDTGATADHLSLASDEALDPAWVEAIWKRCDPDGELLPSNPGALEPYRGQTGVWSTVLAPDVPSAVWASAVVKAEAFSPDRILIFTLPGERAEASIRALPGALLDAAGQDFGAGVECPPAVAVDVTGDGLALPEGEILAPRLTARSAIHFVRRWTAANQAYVRGRYWAATKAARANAEKGLELLGQLDRDRFRRVPDLLELGNRQHGERLFDDYSGGVCFDPGFYEFDLRIPTNDRDVDTLRERLLAYFDVKIENMPFDRPLLRRRMFTNSLVLLRGEGYYANLKELPPWKRAEDYVQEAEALRELFGAVATEPELSRGLAKCIAGRAGTREVWKLLVGALDQARNLGLIMLSVAAFRWGDRGSASDDSSLLQHAERLVRNYYAVLLGDASVGDARTLAGGVRDAAIKGKAELEVLARSEGRRAQESEWYDPGKPIRGWREADSPYENLLTSLLAMDGRTGEGADLAALGMFWGGVELPIVAAVAAEAKGIRLKAYGFLRHGRYSSAAARPDGYYCDLSEHAWRAIGDIADSGASRTLLMDDNSLSGETLESARDMLLAAGVRGVETWVVRFSGERREGQMRMAQGGIVHPAYLRERLNGFLGETPYARSYSRKHYQSPVGVFNTARSRILRYLHNNGFASIYEREGF